MKKVKKDTITVRAISVAFSVIALGVFKPFGLEAWRGEAYLHLLVIFVLGLAVCWLTEQILEYVIRMPRSLDRGVSYIIRRNLWFQIVNTPLVSLMICLYRHFVLSTRAEGNQLSWANFIETLLIIAFTSFSIGLFWRFKFRSRYLELELEEMRQMNEQLKRNPATAPSGGVGEAQAEAPLTLTGTTSETVTLKVTDLQYVEAVGNYVKVYHMHGGQVRTDMLRATSRQIEEELKHYPTIVRSHRAFLVNLSQVEQIVSKAGNMQLVMRHCHEPVPVSRSNVSQVKEAIMHVSQTKI